MKTPRLRALELFSGIGGCAAALRDRAEVVMAVDQNPYAAAVYQANFAHPIRRWNVAGLKAEQLARLDADLWWMSPPCQPFTVRGFQRDTADRRCKPLLRLLEILPTVRPRHIAFENVTTFAGSHAQSLLRQTLEDAGYTWQDRVLNPASLGVPNHRRRYYLLASLDPLPPWREPVRVDRRLADYLDAEPDPALYVPAALLARYGTALPVTHLTDPHPDTFCFTAAYGRSPVHCGSYLRDQHGVRRFSPEEILRLHHFPSDFVLPEGVDRARAWVLAGNSLSVLAVQEVLSPLLD